MYEFLDRFVTSTMPRIRDFNGISERGFDGRGNYTMGIREQIAFPEISIDKISNITGMDVTFVTSTDSDIEALDLLKELGLPFKKEDAPDKLREVQRKVADDHQAKLEVAKDSNNEENNDDKDKLEVDKHVSDSITSNLEEENQNSEGESKKIES
jgi:hypothetical protein